jgi:autophagy-related protein 2
MFAIVLVLTSVFTALQMVTWHPDARVTPNNEIANDLCETALKMLPLRCILDQRAIRFIRVFFGGDRDTDDGSHSGLPPGLHAVPPLLLRHFRVDPVKLKIDYTPQRVDTKALRDGAIVELINLSPLEGMILTLELVMVENVAGLGDALGIVIRRWISHICETQLYKFLTSTRALEPVTSVGGGVADMVILPWEAFQNGESIKKALRSGVSSLSKAFTYEALTTTSRLAHFVAGVTEASATGTGSSGLLSRPLATPRTILDTTPHMIESLSRGLQIANYKVVIIPYREYQRSGTRGAVKSVLKGIPVAIAAPASGAVEALSFALLGARNQIHPDIRREEEASQRGLHFEG